MSYTEMLLIYTCHPNILRTILIEARLVNNSDVFVKEQRVNISSSLSQIALKILLTWKRSEISITFEYKI